MNVLALILLLALSLSSRNIEGLNAAEELVQMLLRFNITNNIARKLYNLLDGILAEIAYTTENENNEHNEELRKMLIRRLMVAIAGLWFYHF